MKRGPDRFEQPTFPQIAPKSFVWITSQGFLRDALKGTCGAAAAAAPPF